MRMQLRRDGIEIVPENEEDEAYLEEVLGAKNDSAPPVCRRVNTMGLTSLAYLLLSKKAPDATAK